MSSNPSFCPRVAIRLAATLAVSLLAGCASVPGASADNVDVPPVWYNAASADSSAARIAGAGGVGSDRWWRDFGSAELNTLIERALDANRDLRIAAARVAQARALAGEADAERRPRLDAVAGSSDGRQTTLDPKARVRSVGLQASWEADVFGQKGLSGRAARLDAESTELMRQAAQTAIAAQVASVYLDAAGLARREVLGRQRLTVAARSEQVLSGLIVAGQATRADLNRRHAETRALRAEMEEIHGAQRLRLLQLAVLLGATPGSLAPTFADINGASEPDLRFAATPRWLPGELLERRPDVQRTAREVDAAAARVGVARLDLYPKFVFTWASASESAQIVDQDAATNIALGYGVSISLPIFDGGRLRSRVAASEARLQEAMAAYEKAMLEALADAETALVRADVSARTLDELDAAARAGASAADKAQGLYGAGLIDQAGALDARQAALRAADAALQARAAEWVAAVDIRRAFCAGVDRQTTPNLAVTK